jgi:hypothetical protein
MKVSTDSTDIRLHSIEDDSVETVMMLALVLTLSLFTKIIYHQVFRGFIWHGSLPWCRKSRRMP